MKTKTTTITIDVEVPVGYELVRFGKAVRGEKYLNSFNDICTCNDTETIGKYAVVTGIEPRTYWLTQNANSTWRVHTSKFTVEDRGFTNIIEVVEVLKCVI